jgi:hypothetical protein
MEPPSESLADNRHLTIMVRLLLTPRGGLVFGEIVDLDGKRAGTFRAWTALGELIASQLARTTDSSPQS